jgi:D-sedoheptulose 7-phosphate isomerase
MTGNFILNALNDSHLLLEKFLSNPENVKLIEKSIAIFTESLKTQGRILSCGNGGSMCDSMHFAEELTGRYRKDRIPLAAMSMGDASHMSCVANDYGYDYVFSRYVEAWGRKGDSLLAISTSGNSKNVIEAVQSAKKIGMKTILLSGKDGGVLKEMADVSIIVPSKTTDRIQEIHIKLIHIFIEGIERNFFPDHYA